MATAEHIHAASTAHHHHHHGHHPHNYHRQNAIQQTMLSATPDRPIPSGQNPSDHRNEIIQRPAPAGAPSTSSHRKAPLVRAEEVVDTNLEVPMDLLDLDMPSPMSPSIPMPSLPELPPTEAAEPSNRIPPEMEEASLSWRQYAAASLFHHNRILTGPFARQIEDDWEMAEESEDGGGDQFRGRRPTVTYRFPTNGSANNNHSISEEHQQHRKNAVARKLSMGHQRCSAEDPRTELYKQALSPRRLSFPERTLYSADYAILRKSVDHIEIVGSFHRGHSEAYRHFLQSLTCYDLAPQHGLLIMIDAKMTIQKAVQILCSNPAPRVAVVSNSKDSHWAMFTVTDCLLALQKAHSQFDMQQGDYNLRHFVENVQNGRRLISVDDQTSVWDLARVFTLNRVHRVPVFSSETSELISILCLRSICFELLKLLDSKCSLSPDLNSILLSSRVIGTWGIEEIASVQEGNSCAQAVDIFLEKQVSALPVLSAVDGTLLGVLDKNNLLDRLFERLGSYQTPERCFQLMEETPVEDLLPQARRRTVRADCSVANAMRVLTEDGLIESLFVVEPPPGDKNIDIGGGEGDRLCGVLSHTDILAYIISCEQQQQIMGPGNS